MGYRVELENYFSRIEGEEIVAYHAYVIDGQNQKWKYSYHRQPRQSIEQFTQEVHDAYRNQRDDDFRFQDEA